MSRVDVGFRARRGKTRSWDWLERTIARKIAQVKASRRDFCRHLGGLLGPRLVRQTSQARTRSKMEEEKIKIVSKEYMRYTTDDNGRME